jgi:type II secretory pathway component PulF
MPQFTYQAKDAGGSLHEGSMEAAARGAVVARLQQMGYFPIRIAEAGAPAAAAPDARRMTKADGTPKVAAPAAPAGSPALPRPAQRPSARPAQKAGARPGDAAAAKPLLSLRKNTVSSSDLASFNRQLADLIASGVPLVRALNIMSRQAVAPALKDTVDAILQEVQGGTTFADALARHDRVFSRLYVAMVKSGEAGGNLPDVLSRLADFSETEEMLKGRVKSALAYPAFMILFGIVALFFMMTFVMPRIVDTFRQMEQTLPALTILMIRVSDFLSQNWMFVAGGVAAALTGAWQFLRTAQGTAMWHRVQLRIPLFGEVVRKREAARFCRTLGSLVRNGVPILTALQIVKEVVTNSLFRADVERIVEEITQGSSVAQPLRSSPVFPPVAVNMIAVGEETGRLADVLIRVSESFETQVDREIRTLVSLLEPVIIVTMGIMVFAVVISMLLPVFSLEPQ